MNQTGNGSTVKMLGDVLPIAAYKRAWLTFDLSWHASVCDRTVHKNNNIFEVAVFDSSLSTVEESRVESFHG